MVTASRLRIFPFENRSGSISYRVSGTLPTGRVQKNFADRTDAQAFVNQHTPKQSAHPPQPVITHLPETTIRRVEIAIGRLPPGTDIVQAVDFFVEHRRPLKPLAMPAAIAAFGAWLTHQRKNEEVTVDSRTGTLTHFAAASGVDRSDRITIAAASEWIYDAEASTRTQRDRFDLLNFFCDFLVRRKHAADNPVAELDRPVHKPRVPGVFTFDEAWTLLQCALTDAEGPAMLPWFAVCVLSGVRPDEAKRLSRGAITENGEPNPWADFYLGDEHRLIEVNKAKGGRRRRNATVHDPLWRILTWCKKEKLDPTYFSRRKFRRIIRRAGLERKWEKDICRHTYASHQYVLTKDVKQLETDMGNSERVLFQSYIRPVPLADGQRFAGLILHYSAPREKSAMGSGPKPRKKKAAGRSEPSGGR